MDLAVVGSPEFTLGFQLAGISNITNPESDEEMASVLKSLLNTNDVGIVVIDSAILAALPERLRGRLSASVTPTVLGIGTEEEIQFVKQ
jgi:V/A-type H+-transporting ATPase subunit F